MASPWFKYGGINTMREKGQRERNDTIPAQGNKPAIHFKAGGLHASTSTKPGAKISASKHAAAGSGKLGPKAKKQEQFFRNVLK